MSSTPLDALEALLNLEPLHIFIQKEARAAMLRVSRCRRPFSSVYCKLLREINDSPIMTMPSDWINTEHHFIKFYSVDIKGRDDWETIGPPTLPPGSLIWYTDGSRKDAHAGAGVYGVRPKAQIAISLGSFASVFQAEMYAILACALENLRRAFCNQNIFIFSDSQAALKALASVEINSKLTLECTEALNRLGRCNRLTLCWVPGHSGLEGNEIADGLARKGAETKLIGPEPACGIPKSSLLYELRSWAARQSYSLWLNAPGKVHTKALLKGHTSSYSSEALNMSRNHLRVLTRTLTGHCRLRRHMCKMGLATEAICRYCQEDEETPIHLLCNCCAIGSARSRTLGGHVLSPEEVKMIPPRKIVQYILDLGLDGDI